MNMIDKNFMIWLLWVLIGVIFFYVVEFSFKKWRIVKMIDKFEGPPYHSSILGNFYQLIEPGDILLRNIGIWSRQYYPHFRLRSLYLGGIITASPEDCEIILGSKKHSVKGHTYLVLKPWLKEGLLLSSGEKWAQRRRILTPAFHFSILKNFLTVFNEQTEKLVSTISQNWENPIDIVPLANKFTLHTITETAMSHKIDEDDRNQEDYRRAIHILEEIFEYRLFRPWLWTKIPYYLTPTCWTEIKLLKRVHGFTRNIINIRMKNFKPLSISQNKPNLDEDNMDNVYMNETKRNLAMLDVLLQAKANGVPIDEDGICEEVDTFLFEGHDTTGSAIGFCLMLLASYPEIQEKAYQEIKEVLGERKIVAFDDLKRMDLLERCIKETLRLYPSVFFINRFVAEDTELHSGLVVPKDCVVFVPILAIHHNPDIYPDPELFNPDRFTPENCKDRHPFAYLPFSAGPRNCIGQKFAMMELKTLLAGVLQNFKLIAVDTPDSIEIKPLLVLRVKNGIKVKFVPR